MRVFITGHKGFIGKNFMESIPSDWCISMFDIADKPDARPSDFNLKEQNLDAVIHLGAISSTTETNVKKVVDNNLSWSIELAEICKESNILFQFASSASVYGNAVVEEPMKETDFCKPLNIYAQSKYLFEQYLLTQDADFMWQAFRYFNVYGRHEQHKETQASPYTQFAKQARETGVIKVFDGSENFYRDFVHVDQVIDIHMRMLYKYERGIFNIGTGIPRSFMSVAKDVATIYDAEIENIPFPEHLKPYYQYYTRADTRKLEVALQS
jgi:ADP-L-glycero-D-manno-heptose 6-epimerase